jgi:multidrug resistance efflux pump
MMRLLKVRNSKSHWKLAKSIVGNILLVWVFAWQLIVSQQLAAQEKIVLKSAIVKTAPALKVPGRQAGLLTQMVVKEGMRIQQGQFIAQVDSAEFELDLAQSLLDHKLAQMDAANTIDRQYFEKSVVVETAEYDRAVAANRRVANSVPLSKLEKHRLEKERAVLQLQQSIKQLEIAEFRTQLTKSKIETAKMKIDRTQIVAPCTGLVVGISKQAGEWVNQSETICEIVSTDKLRLEGLATAKQASQIRSGMSATVDFHQPWLPYKQLTGVVTFVAPAANPVNLQVPVWIEIDNPDNKIVAGLTGDIEIKLIHEVAGATKNSGVEINGVR